MPEPVAPVAGDDDVQSPSSSSNEDPDEVRLDSQDDMVEPRGDSTTDIEMQ